MAKLIYLQELLQHGKADGRHANQIHILFSTVLKRVKKEI